MSFIDIITNNASRELKNTSTYVDNWVYVPGTSKTGDWSKVHAFTSVEQFKETCGEGSPEGSITYEYVCGLLSAGLPVLFRRIACVGQDTESETLGVVAAEVMFNHFDAEANADVNDIKVSEKYGGSFGNDMSVILRDASTSCWLDVYVKNTLLEKKKICSYASDALVEEKNQKIIDGLKATEFERINVEVLNTDPLKFQPSFNTTMKLSQGADFDEGAVAAEIPKSYDFIYDKILFQPKFITSGGHTDEGYTDDNINSEFPIAEAMLKLTKARQDCRALIDLPVETPASEYHLLAEKMSYQQLADNQAIPSASMYGPWLYMQVGTEQLWMPPSYVYLTVVGDGLSKGKKVYTPKAGMSNGKINNVIRPEWQIGSDRAQAWQQEGSVNINPIMRLQNGSYVIAGNSTLLLTDETENNAFTESSADLTVLEIRRFVYNLATELQYQYNSADAFETFALRTSNFLEMMVTEGAITDYIIENITSDSDPRTLKIRLDVFLTPTIKNIEIYLNVAYGSVEISVGGDN